MQKVNSPIDMITSSVQLEKPLVCYCNSEKAAHSLKERVVYEGVWAEEIKQ